MKCFLKKQQGFTLLEALLTLFVVCALVLLPIVNFQRSTARLEATNFINKLQSELYYLQNYAMLKGSPTQFIIYPSMRRVRCVTAEARYDIEFPPAIERIGHAVKHYKFEPHTGNLGNFDRFEVKTTEDRYYFKFQLGSGRFNVEKQ